MGDAGAASVSVFSFMNSRGNEIAGLPKSGSILASRAVRGWASEPFLAVGIVLALAAFAFRVRYGFTRFFEPDEFESIHSTWMMLQGLVPYRDFPALHPYPFWGLLAPIVALWHDKPATALLAARGLMSILTAAILLLTWRLGRRLFDKATGILAVLGLSCLFLFLDESAQIRGDIPAAVCWLFGLGHAPARATRGKARAGMAGGHALGSGVCLVPVPIANGGGDNRLSLAGLGCPVQGCVPGLSPAPHGGLPGDRGSVLMPLALRGALAACWRYAVTWHLHWFSLPITGYLLRSLFSENGLFWVLAIIGVSSWFCSAAKRHPVRPGLAMAVIRSA